MNLQHLKCNLCCKMNYIKHTTSTPKSSNPENMGSPRRVHLYQKEQCVEALNVVEKSWRLVSKVFDTISNLGLKGETSLTVGNRDVNFKGFLSMFIFCLTME